MLDIILESFENNPAMHETFIGLLKHYKSEDDTICQIIGFKFQALHQQEVQLQRQQTAASSSAAESNENGSVSDSSSDQYQYKSHQALHSHKIASLYTVTAYLLKYKMIDLDSLMLHVKSITFTLI